MLAAQRFLHSSSRFCIAKCRIAGSQRWNSTTLRYCAAAAPSESAKLSYIRSTSAIPLLSRTIGQQLDHAAETWSDRESHVFVHQNTRFTFHSLRERARELATGLLALGLQPGDRVGVWAGNSSQWIVAQFATALAGLIQVNVNPAYQADELLFTLHKVGCRALIMSESFHDQDLLPTLRKVTPELDSCMPGDLTSARLPELKHVIIVGRKKPGTWMFDEVMSAGGSSSLETLDEIKKKIQPNDAVNIQFTSGTTGHPKGTTLTHHGLLNNSYFFNIALGFHEEETRICVPVPLYHCFGMVLGSLSCILHGTTAVYPAAVFNAFDSLCAIEQERCTAVYGTPTMFVDFLANCANFNTTSLQKALVGGSPVPAQLVRRMANELRIPKPIIGYGMTESSPIITLHDIREPLDQRIDTAGYVVPHIEVKIVDNEGRTVPVNESGELCTRGYHVMKGYWNEPERTRETITEDHWLRTGDIASLDERGQARIVGRLKDMIIRGGENIFPREIEEVIHKHPKLQDAYVFGIPDERLGEEVCVWAKLKADVNMTADELRQYCSEHLAYFKVPKHVRFVDAFPLTVTGKVQKFRLKELMLAMMNPK